MTDLPKLDLTCLKNPSGRCVLIAESCVNCRNRDIILKHAAAYHRKTQKEVCPNIDEQIEARAARDAVLELAGLTTKEVEEKQ